MSQTVGRYRLGQRLTSDALTGTHEGFARDDRGQEQKVFVRMAKIPEDLAEELLERFRGEAKAASALDHPNVMKLLDHGLESGAAYVVHPPMESMTLRALLEKSDGKKLSPEIVAMVALDAARGLEHAHRKQPPLLHGGISPDALVVDPDGVAHISDFALVNLLSAASNSHSQLLEHTCRYHSPEQAKHRPLTAATDLFSLGATLYEALAGKPAFFAPTPLAIVLKISMASHDKLDRVAPDVPAPLRELVTKMLIAEPGQRPSDDEVVTALEKIVGRADALRQELGARVKPPSERARPAPVPQARVAEEDEWKASSDQFPSFDEIAGEKTQIDSGSLAPALAAPPPARVMAAGETQPLPSPAQVRQMAGAGGTQPIPPPRAPRHAPPFAPEVSIPAQVVDLGSSQEVTDPLQHGDPNTQEIDGAAAPWGVEKTALIDTSQSHSRELDGLSERDTNPPPEPIDTGPFAPQPTLVMVQNPHALPPPAVTRPPPDPFDTRPQVAVRNPPQLVAGWPLPIVVALGVGAVTLMVLAAVLTVWIAS